MAPKLLKVPLAVSLKERLKDKIRQNKAHRLAPPTATHMATGHRLPSVEPSTEADTMAKKKKRKYDADFKAKVVARILKARESGEESVNSIVKAEGISSALAYQWLNAAKKANGALPAESREESRSKPGRKPKATIESLSRELSEALARVDTLKVKLRKLLE